MSPAIAPLPISCQRIDASILGLDPIVAVWINDAPGRGTVILQCYDQAWTAGWSAMGKQSIVEFFLDCDAAYLVGKLFPSTKRRATRAEEEYLVRIVVAVQTALRSQVQA